MPLRLRRAECSRSFLCDHVSSAGSGSGRRLFLLRDRQMQSEGTSGTQFTLDGELSVHGFGDTLGEKKSQTRAVNLRGADRWTAVKRLEDVREIRLVDPDAAVLNRDLNFPVACLSRCIEQGTDADPVALSTVLDGIPDQVLQTVRESRQIAHDRGQI